MIKEDTKRLMAKSLNDKVIGKEDFDLLSKFMNGEQPTRKQEQKK